MELSKRMRAQDSAQLGKSHGGFQLVMGVNPQKEFAGWLTTGESDGNILKWMMIWGSFSMFEESLISSLVKNVKPGWKFITSDSEVMGDLVSMVSFVFGVKSVA